MVETAIANFLKRVLHHCSPTLPRPLYIKRHVRRRRSREFGRSDRAAILTCFGAQRGDEQQCRTSGAADESRSRCPSVCVSNVLRWRNNSFMRLLARRWRGPARTNRSATVAQARGCYSCRSCYAAIPFAGAFPPFEEGITKSPALDSACRWLLPPHASLLSLLCLWDGAMS